MLDENLRLKQELAACKAGFDLRIAACAVVKMGGNLEITPEELAAIREYEVSLTQHPGGLLEMSARQKEAQ